MIICSLVCLSALTPSSKGSMWIHLLYLVYEFIHIVKCSVHFSYLRILNEYWKHVYFRTLTHKATCLVCLISIKARWKLRHVSMAESGEDVLQSEDETDNHLSQNSQTELQSFLNTGISFKHIYSRWLPLVIYIPSSVLTGLGGRVV